MTSTVCLAVAVASFGVATYIDFPPGKPTARERLLGNFCCSLGLLCLALAEFTR